MRGRLVSLVQTPQVLGHRLITAIVMLVVSIAATQLAAQTATTSEVDLELILAVDVSWSMDPDEQRLQRDGYVDAFRDPQLAKAIAAGPRGRIAVTYFEWAGPDIQFLVVPWTVIDGAQAAAELADRLATRQIARHRMTSISSALQFADRQFAASPYRGARRVIDVSGDGANNSGPPLTPIRDRLVESGVVINGLPILLRPTTTWSSWDIPDLDKYYANCVIGGPGAFMVPITTREEFASATRQKLLLEISGLMPQPRVLKVQMPGPYGMDQGGAQPGGKYDCGVLERNTRRW